MTADYISKIDYQPQNISNQICDLLKQAIMRNELQGGEQIVEMALQKKLGVSRSPIREAFRELEKLGLVEIEPRKGTFVKKITIQDIRENYLVRAPLEGLAAVEASVHMDENDYKRLDKAIEGMRSAAHKNEITNYWICHKNFHETFIHACGNRLLINLLSLLRTHSVRHRLAFPLPGEDLNASVKIHEKMIQMFMDQKADKKILQEFVTQHILVILPAFLENASKLTPYQNTEMEQPVSN
ncbi:MAG: GntR family transcriptional regulator [bacterium]